MVAVTLVSMHVSLVSVSTTQPTHRRCRSIKGEKTCRDEELGICDPANAQAVHVGRVKGGTTTHRKQLGVHDPVNAKVVHDVCANNHRGSANLQRVIQFLEKVSAY